MMVGEKTLSKARAETGKQPPVTTVEYTHLPIGVDVLAFAGYYTPEQEVRIPFHERELLYVTGHIEVESACHGNTCTPQNYWYSTVQGYVVNWQYRKSESGLPVTEVEPVSDRETQKEIEDIIFRSEAVSRVEFR